MGKGSSSAPSPDPQIGEAALKQAALGEEWLSFAKDSFKVSTERQKQIDATTQKIVDQQFGVAKDQAAWAKEDRDRYSKTFKPIEDDFIKEATNYATPAKQAEAAAEARADVQTAAATARATGQREAMAMGINPNSGRFAGVQRSGELGTTLAEAGAANNARTAVRDKGLALKADVSNLGKGLPAQSAQAAALGLNAGNSVTGNINAANGQYLASTGIMGQGYSGAQQGYASQANILQNQYNSQLRAWEVEQNSANAGAAGIGSALGSIAGMFRFTSDENEKENKRALADGEALDAVNNMPVEEWDYKEGSGDGGRHVGTYAAEFAREVGGDGKSIDVISALGVSMGAIKDLSSKVDKIAQQVGLGGRKPANSNSDRAYGLSAGRA